MGIRQFSTRCLWLVVAGLTTVRPALAQTPRLTIERVASLPSLSGTAPVSPTWSPDSTRLAFLWNDQGWPFRDVWVVDATGREPKRLTDLSRNGAVERPDATPNEQLAERVAARGRAGVSELVWTPDGNGVVFTHRGNIFRVGADGSGLTRLTVSAGAKYSLTFSPNGRFLSYLQDGDLWLWNQQTNQRVRATRAASPSIGTIPGALFSRLDAEFSSYRWSPDSHYIALEFDDRRQIRKELIPDYLGEETHVTLLRRDYPGDNDHVRAIGILSMDEGRVRLLELGDTKDRRTSSYQWSPDGSYLLVDQNSENAVDRWISIVKPKDGSVREVWHDADEQRTTQLRTSAWQSDGQAILFVADLDGRHRLHALRIGGRTPRQLTSGDWSVVGESGSSPLVVSPSGEVYFVSTKKSPYERQVYRIQEGGGAVTAVTALPGIHHPFLSPDGSKLALLHSSDSSPTELYVIDAIGSATERRLTRSPPEEFSRYRWVMPRYVIFRSHIDGVTLHGRLLEPPDLDRSRKYPVILGPVYSNTVRNRWGDREESRGLYSMLQQYLTIEGQYIGFQVDVRGSVGYGRAFHDRLRLDYGGIDVDDLRSGVEYLKTLPYVDPERIGIWGSSYGGLMTLHSLFKNPGVYKAGVAAAPVSDMRHVTTGISAVMRRPETHPEGHHRGSAIYLGEALQDHLLIIHGMQDSIVLFKDTVTLIEKLMMLGKDFDLAVGPSSIHHWSRKDYVAVYMLRKLVDHFDRHLKGKPLRRPLPGV